MGELSEPASPPKKRRLRRLIAACLVLLSLATWWYWPRLDPRLVGEWQSDNGDQFHLVSDGTCQVTSRFGDYKVTTYYSWDVRGHRLVMQTASGHGLDRLKEELRHIYDELRGIRWPSLQYRVVQISEAAIAVKHLDGAETRRTWHRLSQ